MGNSGLECDCDFDQWLGKLITSVGQCVRRTLIACQSVIQCCNWQLDEAGVPSDTVAQWDRQRRKGQRDHKMGWGNRSDNGLKKANSYPLSARTFTALETERGRSYPDHTLSAQRKETKGGVGGCSGLPRLCHHSWICEAHTWVLLKPVTLWLLMSWSRVWSFVVTQTQAEFNFYHAPIQCTNRFRPWIWSEKDGAIGHYTT